MGLNFYVRCQHHRVVGMIPRGHEGYILRKFYKEHEPCAQKRSDNVEVQADEASEQWWMVSPTPTGYTDISDDLFEQVRQMEQYVWEESQ